MPDDPSLAADSHASLRAFYERNMVREERAQLYRQRRLHNALTLLVAELTVWCGVALVVGGLLSLIGEAPISWPWWGVLMGAYVILSSAARLLPGWGLGVIAELRSLTRITALLGAAISTALAMQHPGWPALVPGLLVIVVAVPGLLAARSLVKGTLLRLSAWGTPVVVYGAAATGHRVVTALHEERGLGYMPVAVFDDDPTKVGSQIRGVPVVGDTSDWTHAAPVAIIAMPGVDRARLVELLDGPLTVYRTVILIPDLFDVQSLWVQGRDLGGILGLQITHNLANAWARRTKRALDLLSTGLTLPLWGPLCLLLGGLIWLEDRANPLFLQERVGLGGQVFKTWKFRTMVPDAEAVLRQRLAEDSALRAEWETHFKLRRDPRITRVGRFLRKTSLDELPQLVNVLKGDMALVGPRPLPLYHLRELPANVQRLRHEVRPGMTGLWQVSGRSDAGNEGMIRLDPYYVRNWSVWLDAVILLRTFRAVVRSAGAY